MPESDEVHFKRLSECSFEDAVRLWNEGFQQYYSDMTLTLPRFLARTQKYGIRPELSIVACVGEQLAGFVLIALQPSQDGLTAWNGGTGVNPIFRGQGIAKKMMAEVIKVLKGENVGVFWLEVVQVNNKAIAAYESVGFKAMAELTTLVLEGEFAQNPFVTDRPVRYRCVLDKASAVSKLSLYDSNSAWGNQWYCLSGSQSLVLYDDFGKAAGYALFDEHVDASGKSSIALHQCVADPQRDDTDDVLRHALAQLFAPMNHHCKRRTAPDIPSSKSKLIDLLLREGFTIKTKQYLMQTNLAEK